MGTNTIFIGLPGKETLAIRRLPQNISLESLKSKIELEAGLHGNGFNLAYGEILIPDTEELRFDENIRNGGMLKIIIPPLLMSIYDTILDGNIQKLAQICVEEKPQDDDLSQDGMDFDVSVQDRLFFALLLCCRKGELKIARALISLDPECGWKRQCTKFGRTLAHISASSDQGTMIDFLINTGAPVHIQDNLNQSPLEVAVDQGAFTCERLLKQALLNGSRNKSHSKKTLPTRKVCWADMSSPKNISQTSHKQSPTARHAQTPNLLGATFTASRPSSSRVNSGHRSTNRMASSATKSSGKENNLPYSHVSGAKCNHKGCLDRKPFMAYRNVNKDEYRPLSVEYVPLNTLTPDEWHGHESKHALHSSGHISVPAAPCSSLNNSTENLADKASIGSSDDEALVHHDEHKEKILQKREELRRIYSKVQKTSYRAQSAKYYRTKYHQENDDGVDVPKARPATAGPRYREWKTWMLEKLEQDEEKKFLEENNAHKHQMNAIAFKKWLRRKRHQEQHEDSSESSEEEYDPVQEAINERAYKRWLTNKKEIFDKMDKERKEMLRENNREDYGSGHKNRKVTVFELGYFGENALPKANPNGNMYAFQSWKGTKAKYERWVARKGLKTNSSNPVSKEDINRMRRQLLLEGMTYTEWLGLKEKERAAAAKLNVHDIGKEGGPNLEKKKNAP